MYTAFYNVCVIYRNSCILLFKVYMQCHYIAFLLILQEYYTSSYILSGYNNQRYNVFTFLTLLFAFQSGSSQSSTPAHMPTMSDKTFNILQWNANGIGNKQPELSTFLEMHNVKVAAIQESKLTTQLRSPITQNYTLVWQDRRICPGGGLQFLFITQSASLASHCQQQRMTPT